ncbi:uncharacterized protein LOC142563570 [Dermacentor variabilis]|uniref:uncharacterized protein LOC142563570 n=1 Tax=Dermacentor variabilis TaxID=34621 RepID=UPI003F5B36B2
MEFVHHLVILTVLICEASAKNFCDGENEEDYYCNYKGETYSGLCPYLTGTCSYAAEKTCICKQGYFRRRFWNPCVTWRECVVPHISSLQILRSHETLFLTKASGTALFTRLVRCFKSHLIVDGSGRSRTVEFQQRNGTISIAEIDQTEEPTEDDDGEMPTNEATPQANNDASLNASATDDELLSCIWCPALRPLDAHVEPAQMAIEGNINSRSFVQTRLETVRRSVRQSVKERSNFVADETDHHQRRLLSTLPTVTSPPSEKAPDWCGSSVEESSHRGRECSLASAWFIVIMDGTPSSYIPSVLEAYLPVLSHSTIFCTRMITASLSGNTRHQDGWQTAISGPLKAKSERAILSAISFGSTIVISLLMCHLMGENVRSCMMRQ